jgi:predicted DNA-binding transcriptional regulator AlpA
MTEAQSLRIRDVGACLGVSHQRADQMFHEGKFPEPERVDAIGPLWKPKTIERWAKREWWGTRRWRKRSGRR